jgi:hypothetical protein
MNYSGARRGIPESGWFEVVRAWCTGHCPMAHRTVWRAILQHTQVLLLLLNYVPIVISFLVKVA